MQKNAATAFMRGLIDYAGLFPPAELPLKEAISNYARYIKEDSRWMMGPFVIPAARLQELNEHRSLFSSDAPLRLSVIVKSLDEMEQLSAFSAAFGELGSITALETPLTDEKSLEQLLEQTKLPLYAEVPVQQPEAILDRIKAIRARKGRIGVKVRMGGVSADRFPEASEAARMIDECRKRGLPMKFTAGLHHPIREYRPEVQTKMHGFVNIFTAAIMAHSLRIDERTIEQLLLDEQPEHFSFAGQSLAWNGLTVTSEQINQARRQFAGSYGSCSFDEPREEFSQLAIFS